MEQHNAIIDALGGTVAVAKLCRVTPQAVSHWRERGIPAARLMFLEAIRPAVVAESITTIIEAAEDN